MRNHLTTEDALVKLVNLIGYTEELNRQAKAAGERLAIRRDVISDARNAVKLIAAANLDSRAEQHILGLL